MTPTLIVADPVADAEEPTGEAAAARLGKREAAAARLGMKGDDWARLMACCRTESGLQSVNADARFMKTERDSSGLHVSHAFRDAVAAGVAAGLVEPMPHAGEDAKDARQDRPQVGEG